MNMSNHFMKHFTQTSAVAVLVGLLAVGAFVTPFISTAQTTPAVNEAYELRMQTHLASISEKFSALQHDLNSLINQTISNIQTQGGTATAEASITALEAARTQLNSVQFYSAQSQRSAIVKQILSTPYPERPAAWAEVREEFQSQYSILDAALAAVQQVIYQRAGVN